MERERWICAHLETAARTERGAGGRALEVSAALEDGASLVIPRIRSRKDWPRLVFFLSRDESEHGLEREREREREPCGSSSRLGDSENAIRLSKAGASRKGTQVLQTNSRTTPLVRTLKQHSREYSAVPDAGALTSREMRGASRETSSAARPPPTNHLQARCMNSVLESHTNATRFERSIGLARDEGPRPLFEREPPPTPSNPESQNDLAMTLPLSPRAAVASAAKVAQPAQRRTAACASAQRRSSATPRSDRHASACATPPRFLSQIAFF